MHLSVMGIKQKKKKKTPKKLETVFFFLHFSLNIHVTCVYSIGITSSSSHKRATLGLLVVLPRTSLFPPTSFFVVVVLLFLFSLNFKWRLQLCPVQNANEQMKYTLFMKKRKNEKKKMMMHHTPTESYHTTRAGFAIATRLMLYIQIPTFIINISPLSFLFLFCFVVSLFFFFF
jgi:hypothetical protein